MTKSQRIGLTSLRSSLRRSPALPATVHVVARREDGKITLKIPANLDFAELE